MTKDSSKVCAFCNNKLGTVFDIKCHKRECQKWFHGSCVNIPQSLGLKFVTVLGQISWTCPGCCSKSDVLTNKMSILEPDPFPQNHTGDSGDQSDHSDAEPEAEDEAEKPKASRPKSKRRKKNAVKVSFTNAAEQISDMDMSPKSCNVSPEPTKLPTRIVTPKSNPRNLTPPRTRSRPKKVLTYADDCSSDSEASSTASFRNSKKPSSTPYPRHNPKSGKTATERKILDFEECSESNVVEHSFDDSQSLEDTTNSKGQNKFKISESLTAVKKDSGKNQIDKPVETQAKPKKTIIFPMISDSTNPTDSTIEQIKNELKVSLVRIDESSNINLKKLCQHFSPKETAPISEIFKNLSSEKIAKKDQLERCSDAGTRTSSDSDASTSSSATRYLTDSCPSQNISDAETSEKSTTEQMANKSSPQATLKQANFTNKTNALDSNTKTDQDACAKVTPNLDGHPKVSTKTPKLKTPPFESDTDELPVKRTPEKSAARLKSTSKKSKKVSTKRVSPSEESGYEEDVEPDEETQMKGSQTPTITSDPQASTSRASPNATASKLNIKVTATPTRSSRRIHLLSASQNNAPEAAVQSTQPTDILTKQANLKHLEECDTEPEIEQPVQPTSPVKSKKTDFLETSSESETDLTIKSTSKSTLNNSKTAIDTSAKNESSQSECEKEQPSKPAPTTKSAMRKETSSSDTESENEKQTVKAGIQRFVTTLVPMTESKKLQSKEISAECETEPVINSSPVKLQTIATRKSIEEQSTECETSHSDLANDTTSILPTTWDEISVDLHLEAPHKNVALSPTKLGKSTSVIEPDPSSSSESEPSQVLTKSAKSLSDNLAIETGLDTGSSSDEDRHAKSSNKGDIAKSTDSVSKPVNDSSSSDSDEKMLVIVQKKNVKKRIETRSSEESNSDDEKLAKNKKVLQKKRILQVRSVSDSESNPANKSLAKSKPYKQTANREKSDESSSSENEKDQKDLTKRSETSSEDEAVSGPSQKRRPQVKDSSSTSTEESSSDDEKIVGTKKAIKMKNESSESSSDERIFIKRSSQKAPQMVRSSERKPPPKRNPNLDSYLKMREKKLKLAPKEENEGESEDDSNASSDKESDSSPTDLGIVCCQSRVKSALKSDSEEEIQSKFSKKRKLSFDSDEEQEQDSVSKPSQRKNDEANKTKKKKPSTYESEVDEEVEELDDSFVVDDDQVEYESETGSSSGSGVSQSDEEEAEDDLDAKRRKKSQKSSDYSCELDNLKKMFSRQTENDLKNRDLFLSPSQSKLPNVEKKKTLRNASEAREIIYKPLIKGLRPMASRKGLSPVEILSEWKLYSTMDDVNCSGVCVCGRTGLRHLNWMHNINIKDKIKQTLDHKVCIGSECIHWFNKCLTKAQEDEIDSPIVLFDIFLRKGIVAFYRGDKMKKKRWLTFSFKGKYAEYLRDNIDEINLEYKFKLVSKPKCVEIKVRVGKCCKNADKLEVDKKYRIFLKTKVRHDHDLEEGAPKTHFFLTRFEAPKKALPDGTSTADQPQSAKKYFL